MVACQNYGVLLLLPVLYDTAPNIHGPGKEHHVGNPPPHVQDNFEGLDVACKKASENYTGYQAACMTVNAVTLGITGLCSVLKTCRTLSTNNSKYQRACLNLSFTWIWIKSSPFSLPKPFEPCAHFQNTTLN